MGLTDPGTPLGARLCWVGLVVTDVEAAARLLADDLGLCRRDVRAGGAGTTPLLVTGTTALALLPPGHPLADPRRRAGVDHVALAVPDLARAVEAVRDAGLSATGVTADGLDGRRCVRLAPDATAGVRTCLTEALDQSAAASGPVERLDHVGVACADTGAALEAFAGRLGFPVESAQSDVETHIAVESFTSDRYGVVVHARPPEVVGGLRVTFVTVGEGELEFLQDLDPRRASGRAEARPGDTRQDRGAIARFVASHGPGLHHVALRVTDVDVTLEALARAGHALIDRTGRPGSRRARIGFLHPRSLHGALVHLVERTPPGPEA